MPQPGFAFGRASISRQKPGQVPGQGSEASKAPCTAGSGRAFDFDFSSIPRFAPLSPIHLGLEIGAAHDSLEREADRTAAMVMRAREPASVQRSLAGASPGSSSSNSAMPAPASVHAALRTPGQPLDANTRAFFEPRFGRDFGNVRVHTDAESAASARALDAQAYASGQDIVFAENQFAPSSAQGRNLLAHELAHVVQATGDPTVVRRKGVATWGGRFDTDLYNAWAGHDEDKKEVCGAQIKLKFQPGPAVEADKISLVQIASSSVNNKVVPMEHGAMGESTGWTPSDSPSHVDTSTLTPLYGQKPGADAKLSSSAPITGSFTSVDWKKKTITDSGYRKKSGKGFATKEAWLYDEPSLTVPKSDGASQHFETAAIAVEGQQQGAFYGSVLWGYDKAAGQTLPKAKDLKIGANGSPSADFLSAAQAWNAFQPAQGSVLPLPEEQFTSNAILYAQQNSASGRIKAGDEVTLLPPSPALKGEIEAIVVSGPRKGNQDTLPSAQISSKPPAR